MTNSKSTKRALFTCAMATFLCVAMLIGTTFAWFTDSASTAVNRIQSGSLDVALEMSKDGGATWESAEGKTLDFLKAGGANEKVLWEPGCTYELPQLRVVNKGNLALKYIIKITGIQGDAMLNDVIDWTINDVDINLAEEYLLPNKESAPFTIKGKMQTTAGNEYQNLSIDGVSVTVYATQDTVENDSRGNQYDKDAAYKGTQDFTSGSHTLNKGGVALNPNDTAVKVTGQGTKVTIKGGYYDGGSGGDNKCISVGAGSTVTIKDGSFTVGKDATGVGNSVIFCSGGTVIIEGGFFWTDYAWNGFYYVLNQHNSNPGTITVKGGTFVNYDPSKGDDNLGGNFVADGYCVVSETKSNGDVWYTVVKGTGVKTSEELTTAVTSAKSGDTIVLNESTTEPIILNNTEPLILKDVTFKSAAGVAVNGLKLTSASTATKVTLENVTFEDVTFTDQVSIGQSSMTNGASRVSGVTFKNCTFDMSASAEKYKDAISHKQVTVTGTITEEKETNAYLNGLTVENCTFKNARYAVKAGRVRNMTVKGCNFINLSAAALNISDIAGNVIVSDNTADRTEGFLVINTVGNNYSTNDIKTDIVIKNNVAKNMTCGNGDVFTATFDNAKKSGKSVYTITGNSCTYTQYFENPLNGFRIKKTYGPSTAEFIDNK